MQSLNLLLVFVRDAQEWQCVENVDLAKESYHLSWDDFDALETERVGASNGFAVNRPDSDSYVDSVMISMAFVIAMMINHMSLWSIYWSTPRVCKAIGAVVHSIYPLYRPA